ncbi:MAG: transporter substrate-binding domain-containing protein [Anaerolineae bacterium]|nr:transporter substrate-binding domain-containing protein [Anaerolineae bacterium]
MKKLFPVLLLAVMVAALAGCATPTPQIIEVPKEVVVEKTVIETVEVVKEVVVEVEAEKCIPKVGSPPLLNEGIIIVTINPTIPPYQYVDEDGNLAGMRVELQEEFARRLCLDIAWIRMDFAAMIPGLTAGRFDMINTGTFFKEERAAIMEVVPFELAGMAISVPPDDPNNVQTVDDLAGLVVGVESAGVEEKTLREISDALVAKGLEAIDVRTFTDFALSFAALEAGQTDAAMSVDAAASHFAVQGTFKTAISAINPTPSTMAFASTLLAQVHADVLQEMYEDGTYQEIYERWGLAGTMLMSWKDWSDPNGDPDNKYSWEGEFKVY